MESESISLYESDSCGHTKVSNHFIDHFMTNANEAQIKIYLYLLRSVSSGKDVSLPIIADRFNYTERDIIRALIYWDKQGLISLDYDEYRNVKGICLNVIQRPVVSDSSLTVSGLPSPGIVPHSAPESPAESLTAAGQVMPSGQLTAAGPVTHSEDLTMARPVMPSERLSDTETDGRSETASKPARPFYPAGQLQDFKENPEVRGLLFTAEKYLRRTLSHSDLNSILYMYDNLRFDAGLIEYLIEYCVSSGHRNIHYIESVARDWNDRGIRNIEQAKYETGVNRKEYYEVMKAFGLSGRNPVKPEIDFIRRWKDDYGFSSELIIEAANRTMSAISKPSFQYADSILKNWKEHNVSKLSDVEDADRAYEAGKKEKEKINREGTDGRSTKFQNFHERDIDFSDLEKKFARN